MFVRELGNETIPGTINGFDEHLLAVGAQDLWDWVEITLRREKYKQLGELL